MIEVTNVEENTTGNVYDAAEEQNPAAPAEIDNIYDVVEQLLVRVEALENQTGDNIAMLTENTDLNLLTVGLYYIPTAAICATILNKPDVGNATAFVRVVPGGSEGQMMMYYYPCSKEGASYHHKAFYGGTWGAWNDIDVYDSGWVDLALSGDVIAFNEEQKPRIRRIGKVVYITGVVKNISANDTVIAVLPANRRPTKKVIFAIPSTGTKFSRISILTNGTITYEQSNDGVITSSNWHSIACSFVCD